ncbi:hypothetical protein D3C73_278470 [compost metagenome]
MVLSLRYGEKVNKLSSVSIHEERQQAAEKAKELIKGMSGLSEESFQIKLHNDPAFNKGFQVIVGLIIQAK